MVKFLALEQQLNRPKIFMMSNYCIFCGLVHSARHICGVNIHLQPFNGFLDAISDKEADLSATVCVNHFVKQFVSSVTVCVILSVVKRFMIKI
jgi:hypothetical protein